MSCDRSSLAGAAREEHRYERSSWTSTIDAPLIGAFLTHLETDRGNSTRTRNNRLAAIHSLYRYAALQHPEHAQTTARVMAIPTKRYQQQDISDLDLAEIKALLGAPDRSRWEGRRDHALLLTMIHTGIRVSELTTLRVRDINPGRAAHLQITARDANDAVTLTRETAATLDQWLTERQGQPDEPLFPTRQGNALSRDDPPTRCSRSSKPPDYADQMNIQSTS